MKKLRTVIVVSFGLATSCQAKTAVDSIAPAQTLSPRFVQRLNQDLPQHGRIRFQSREVYTPAHYTSKLGVVCQQELKLDQRTPIALRLRLGSVESCDYLEGKRRKME